MINAHDIIIAELETLLAANPKVEVKDGAGIVRARSVDQSIRRKAIEDCLAVARGCVADHWGRL